MAGAFQGKVALVTGGGSGIGRATSLAFAGRGAKVVVADIASAGGEETVRLVKAAGGEAAFVKADVARAAEAHALIAAAVKTYGQLDYAHNNAGLEGLSAPTADCTEENWDRVLAVNLKGVWLCMKYEIPQMLTRGGGAIVNTASAAGLVGLRAFPAYAASKHAVLGLTKTAALEYAKAGLRINAVCPGFIRTPMVDRQSETHPDAAARLAAAAPMGRLGTPEEVAAAVLWLCSDEAAFITGQALTIDGGIVAA